MGAAVGYGTMLGTVPRECPHCAGDAAIEEAVWAKTTAVFSEKMGSA